MSVSIGPRIQVDGEEGYRKQISNIIQQTKTLDAEMKALTATFGDEDSAQQRAAKSTELLNQQLEAARERTRLVGEMTQMSIAQTGENSTQTLKWREALAAAEEQQAKLEHAAEENTKALVEQNDVTEQSEEKMTGLGDTIDSIADKLGIHLPDAAKEALNGVEGFSAGSVAALGAVAAGAAAVLGVIKELHEMTLEAAEQADALLTRSAQTGLDTELLQQLDYAQRFLDFDGIDQSLARLTQTMGKARDGAAEQSEAFRMLGVSVTNEDGSLRDNYDTFLDVIDALGDVENETERDVVANNLFGKSYRDLKPLVDAGSKSLQQFTREAKENGVTLTNDQVRKLGEVDDAHQKLQATIDGTKNKIAADFAPASKQAMETFAKAVDMAGDTLEETGIIRNTAALVENIVAVVDAGLDMVDALPSWVNPIENVSKTLKGLAVVAATVADSMSLVASLMTLDFHGAATALGWNVGKGEMSHLQQLKYSDPKYVSYNAAGTDFWRGGATWLGESGPELVELPRGSVIHSSQESSQIAAASKTDTRRMEQLQAEEIAIMRDIKSELAARRMLERMAKS